LSAAVARGGLTRDRVDISYPLGYTLSLNRIERSEEFATWLERLSDKKGKARILSRIDAAVLGNFGDCEPVGEGVSEMRVHFGPGYRVYYTRREAVVYLLLLGGDKTSQERDIKRAKAMSLELKKSDAEKQKLLEKTRSAKLGKGELWPRPNLPHLMHQNI
jgi:putative addiction module killer protein